MVLENDGEALVKVRCLQKTIYGNSGEIGYMPEFLVDGWVEKGRVERIVEPKPVKKVESKPIKKPKKKKTIQEVVDETFPILGDVSGVEREDDGSQDNAERES